MMQSLAATLLGSILHSLPRKRAAVFTPVMIATVAVSSLALAQEPATSAEPSAAQPVATTPAPVPSPSVRTNDEASLRPAARVHEGFYLRFSSGPSFVSLAGHGPTGSASLTNPGGGGFVALGGALVPGLVLAGTVGGTSFNAEFKGGPFADATVSSNGNARTASNRATGGFGTIGMLLDWYPQPKAGWHAGVSTGLGIVNLTSSADESRMTGVNLAGSVFGGYDWSLGRDWSLGLQLVANGGTRTKLMDESGSRDTGYRFTPLSIGVQASILYF